jgi:hypothetical protein
MQIPFDSLSTGLHFRLVEGPRPSYMPQGRSDELGMTVYRKTARGVAVVVYRRQDDGPHFAVPAERMVAACDPDGKPIVD